MICLLDTGVLLRLIDRMDSLHLTVKEAVNELADRGVPLVTSTQNFAELWNVATRPVANNGLGLTSKVAITLVEQVIEPLCQLVFETDQLFPQLKRLGKNYDFGGKQVHDARLIALMLCCNIDSILTLNNRHFLKYQAEGIQVLSPTFNGPSLP
jgi:predicted nucleic acid-binding protein